MEWVVAQFATPKIGAILVNVNPAYRTTELSYALRQSGVSVLLSQFRYKSSEFARMLVEVRDELPDLRTIVQIGDDEVDSKPAGSIRWDDVLEPREPSRLKILPPSRPKSSSTTRSTSSTRRARPAFPRARRSPPQHPQQRLFHRRGMPALRRADRVCIPVPFYHCFGMVMGNLACSHARRDHGHPRRRRSIRWRRWRPSQRERCTSLYGVPTMFIAELDASRRSASSICSTLRTGIMAGSPCPIEVMKRVQTEMHMREVTIAYGMTETSRRSRPQTLDRRSAREAPGPPSAACIRIVEVKIVDANGRVVPRGDAGRTLHARLFASCSGYWDDPEQHRARPSTRRAGCTPATSRPWTTRATSTSSGRIKDMVIRGGENLYPREIEEFLYTHP